MPDKATREAGAGWDDYIVSGTAIGVHPTTNPPSFEQIGVTGLYGYNFGVGDQGWFNIHIKHDYKIGSKVYPHVHWCHTGISNGNDVHFEIGYAPAKGYNQQAFPALVGFEIIATPHATPSMHQIDEASDIQAFNTNLEVDTLVLCRIKRVTNGGTEFDGAVFLHQIDFHVEIDGNLTKERNFPFSKV